MVNVLEWIRKSKGSDDDVGLEEQRQLVHQLASELTDDPDTLDLGVHTGFSTMTRDENEGLLDQNHRVEKKVSELREGEYDYVVALDDRRVCRDEYFAVIKHAMEQGGAEFEFVETVAEDDLTHDIRRRIERETKEEEIRKAKRALQRRRENGYDEGRPRKGTQYDDEGEYLVPAEEFETVLQVILMREQADASYSEIRDNTGYSNGTINRIVDRTNWYKELAQQHNIPYPQLS